MSLQGGNRPRVTVVVSHLVPTLGMEGAALRLLERLDDETDLTVVSLAGGRADRTVWPSVAVTSEEPLTGLRRLLTLFRARRMLKGDASDVRVLVGAPAAAAVLLTGRARADADIVWEHSLSAERLASSRALRLVWRLLGRRYARVRAVVAVSPPVAQLVASVGARTELIPNLLGSAEIDSPRGSSYDPSAPVELLAVGTLSTVKNHVAVLDVLGTLPASTTLTVLGDGPLRSELTERARAAGVLDRVTFAGHVSPAEVESAARRATVLVHPSLSETFGLVYFEAARHRLPVVSLDHPAALWLVPRYIPGVTVPQGRLADGIEQVLQNYPDEAVWLASADARRDEFSDDATAARWTRLIHEIAS